MAHGAALHDHARFRPAVHDPALHDPALRDPAVHEHPVHERAGAAHHSKGAGPGHDADHFAGQGHHATHDSATRRLAHHDVAFGYDHDSHTDHPRHWATHCDALDDNALQDGLRQERHQEAARHAAVHHDVLDHALRPSQRRAGGPGPIPGHAAHSYAAHSHTLAPGTDADADDLPGPDFAFHHRPGDHRDHDDGAASQPVQQGPTRVRDEGPGTAALRQRHGPGPAGRGPGRGLPP